jgi:hypothetical protein
MTLLRADPAKHGALTWFLVCARQRPEQTLLARGTARQARRDTRAEACPHTATPITETGSQG